MIIDLKKLASPKRRPSYAGPKIKIRRKDGIAFEPPKKAKSLVKIVYFTIIAAVVVGAIPLFQSLFQGNKAKNDKAQSKPAQTQKVKEYVITLKPPQKQQSGK